MPRTIETLSTFTSDELIEAAELTAAGFGRENNAHNMQDTADHLLGADIVQFMREDEKLIAFAAYRRLLWR